MPQKTKTILLFSRIFNLVGLIVAGVGVWRYIDKFIDFTPPMRPHMDGFLFLCALINCPLQACFRSYKEEIEENRCGTKTVRNLILTVIGVNVFGFAFMFYVFHLCGYL